MLLKKEKQKKNIQERFSSPFLFLDSLQKNKTKTISLPETAEKNKTQKKSTFCHWKKLSFLKKSLALSIIFALVTAVYFQNSTTTQGASYTWNQTNWSGGATVNNATHTTNQTGWTEYSAKDANLSAVNAGADLQVGTQTNTWTVTDDGTTDTGFNNTGAAMSSTTVSESGSGAGIVLSSLPQIDNTADITFTGSTVSGYFGIEASNAGDVNNDGFQDIIVGSYGNDRAYIYYGGASMDSTADVTLTGTAATSFGYHVSGAGDVNNDGFSDVIVGSYGNDRAYIYYGGSSMDSTADVTLTGAAAGDTFGIGLSDAGDVNNDGFSDVIVGAEYNDAGGSSAGRAYIYYGGSGMDSTADVTLTGAAVNDRFGYSVSNAGDVNNDGFSDVIVGALTNDTAAADAGAAYIYYGGSSMNSTVDVTLTGVAAADYFGTRVSTAGDVNNDGFDDVFVGAYANDTGGSFAGQAYIYYGGSSMNSTVDVTLTGAAANDYFSFGMSNAGDVNNDGFSDVIVGSYLNDSGGADAGRAYIYYGGAASAGYRSSGTFISHIYDTTANTSLGTLSWTATTPANTSITIKARSGNQSDLSDATAWGSCTNITSGSALSTGGCVTNGHRYLQFEATLSTTDTSVTPTLSDVSLTYTNYPTAAQTLTSSSYNSSSSVNVISQISWNEDASLPTSTNIQFQLRTAPDSSGSPGTWTSFLGPDGTTGTYFSNTGTGCSKASTTVTCTTIPSAFTDSTNDQWMNYKVFLTASTTATPTLSDITLGYVANAPPQFDTSFNTTGATATQNSDGTVTIQYQIRDPDTTTGTVTPNAITPSFEYSTNGGTGYSTITSTYLAATDLQNKTVGESSYTLYSATWNPKNQLGSSTYVTNAKIRVTINDNEAANNTANAATANFTLDTTNPTSPSVAITTNNNAAAPGSATLTLSASDDSSLQMKVGLVSDLSDASWETYATSKTITLATDPDTVYAQFKDAYGNTSSIVSATTPETPTAMMVQDTSNFNLTPNELRLFIAWKVTAAPSPGFKRYNILRSTDNSAFSSIATVTDINTNYYADSTVAAGASYYYKVSSQDNNDNLSFFSSTIQAKADGIQNLGEGGGGTDSTGPTISSVTSSSIQTTQATITWTTNELSSSTVGFSEDTSFTSEQGVASYVTSHSVTLTGLTPNTAYKFQVKSTDPTGNLTTDNNSSAGYTFTTANGPAI